MKRRRESQIAVAWALATAVLIVPLSQRVLGQAVPQFRDYPAASYRISKPPKLDLTIPEVRRFKTRLLQASKEKPDFAGHYVVTYWGCGSPCIYGAVVDLLTGSVHFFPTSVCCWGNVDDGFKAVEYRFDSKLIVLSGGGDGPAAKMGSHFFVFDDDAFTYLTTAEMTTDFKTRIIVEP